MYSEKATKFCEIFALLLSYVVPFKSKVKISQNFVAFSEYMNLNFKKRFICGPEDLKKNCFALFVSTIIILRSKVLRHHFYLSKVMIQVQYGNGGLNRLVPCLKYMKLASLLLQDSLWTLGK